MYKQVTGVIFDCDGTLLNSMDAWFAAQNELADRAGAHLTDEDVDLVCTLTIPETGAFFHDRFGLGGTAQEVVDMIYELMGRHYAEKVVVRKGALEFVKALADQGVACSVASSTPRALLEIGLGRTGFLPYMKAVVSVDDAGASKREPAVYDYARDLMGTAKESTWVFEDSAYALKTLLKAEYHTVGIYDNDTAGTLEELAIADITIEEFTDLDPVSFVAGQNLGNEGK